MNKTPSTWMHILYVSGKETGLCADSKPSATMLLLLLLLLTTAATTNCAAASSSSTGHGSDVGALLSFKEKISHHSGVLDSWNQSTSYCSWEGVTCGTRHRWRVVALNLNSQGLTGTISPAIGNLTFLRSLNLSSNTLQGVIPPSIGSLMCLRRIDLSENMLTGVIPSNISRCISLQVMAIGSNKGCREASQLRSAICRR